MFKHTIESYLSLQFCQDWAKRWRNTGFIGLVALIFQLLIQGATISAVPISFAVYTIFVAVDCSTLYITLDSFAKSRAYARRAKELWRGEGARRAVAGW